MTLLAMSLLPLVSWAGVVTADQAKAEAAAFAQGRSVTAAVQMTSKAQRAPQATTAFYYVFNIGNNQGFVIISGDDRTNPILGYSDTGYFDEAKIPANMKSWLAGYAEQIKALDTMSDSQAATMMAAPRRASVPTRNSIAPMVTTRWNQAAPYWNKCPEFMSVEDGDTIGELAYTGCVATSMSQIMNYHKWPQQTTKVIPSYTFSIPNGDYTYSSVSMEELPVTTFDWAHMKDSYNGSEEAIYTDAVATLMYYAGAAVKSQYGVSSTGAYTDDIPKGLTEYFAYDASTIAIKFRTDFTQEAWDNLVYDELAAGRPLIYNGTAGSSGGHSFVCDGYEYGDYFHINWGWGGMGNGYFQLAVLNPRESGIGGSSSSEGYNMKQNVIIGIQPGDPSGSTEPTPTVEDALTVTGLGTYGTFTRDSQSEGFSIYKNKYFTMNYADHVGTQKKYDVGVAFYTMDGEFHSMIINRGIYATALTSALGSYIALGKDINDARNAVKMGKGMVGTYKIVPMYQLQGTTEWKPMLESDRYYLECTMTATQATFTAHPILGLEIQEMEFEGGEKVGSQEQIHVTLKNNSTDRYFGDLYLQFGSQQLDEYSQYTTAIQAEVLAGQTKTVTFNVTPANAGTQTLRLYYDANCSKQVTGSGSVTISASSEAALNMSVVIAAENAVDGVIYDSHAHFRVDITNNGTGEFNKFVLAPLFLVHKDEGGNVTGGDMITYSQSSLNLQPGETKTLYFDFNELAYGETYSLNIYARNENSEMVNLVERGHSVYYDIRRGLVTWDGTSMTGTGVQASGAITIPANALAARLEGLEITSVTPSGNPNTIYFLGENETIPAGLNGLNVVKGNVAETIALKDGYGYFIPQSLTAGTISYERTFAAGRVAGQDGGFSSMVLPFAPETVKAEGRDLVPYTTGDDADKDYWVLNFDVEDDGVARFDYADQIEANVPYAVTVNSKLAGKAVTMAASNVTLKAEPIAYTSADNYVMAGTFVTINPDNAYTVNTQGNRFVFAEQAQQVDPFRAYFFAQTEVSDNGYIEIVLSETPEQPVEGLKGDVNLDGTVDVSDVNIVINIILGKDQAENYARRAYITDDDSIDVSDVNAIINIILCK